MAPGRYGYAEALQSAGMTVAPLLAGFTITLLGLLVNTSSGGIRYRNLALVIFAGAIASLLAAIQCAYEAREFAATPAQIESWWPGIEDAADAGEVDMWWELRAEQRAHQSLYNLWAKRFRVVYHLGVVLLLVGLVVVLIPPNRASDAAAPHGPKPTHVEKKEARRHRHHHKGLDPPSTESSTTGRKATASGIPTARWVAISIAGLAALLETAWILATYLAATRTSGKSKRRTRAGRWVATHWPLRAPVEWFAPSYPDAIARARIDLQPRREIWEGEQNPGVAAPPAVADQTQPQAGEPTGSGDAKDDANQPDGDSVD